jgi:hypothetical protein
MLEITGIEPILSKMNNLLMNQSAVVENSMTNLMNDVRNQALDNLRSKLLGTTFSRGYHSNRMPLTDNLSAWEIEKISFSEGSPGVYQWKLWNRSEHAAAVETGTRSVIKPIGEYLYLGANTYVKEVKGQGPKHFLGDALYYNNDRWLENLTRYLGNQINAYVG